MEAGLSMPLRRGFLLFIFRRRSAWRVRLAVVRVVGFLLTNAPPEASTIPLAAGTAAVGLYQRLGLPLPWNPATRPIPLVIYGGATSVGAFAIKLARLSNIHPIITVAGNGIPFVETLIDTTKGDTVVDYRHGDEAVRAGIRKAAGNNPIAYAFDAVSEGGSVENIFDVLEKKSSKVTTVLRVDQDKIPSGIEHVFTYVGTVHKAPSQPGAVLGDAEFGHVIYRFLARGLAQGWFSGHPYEVVPGGLNGIEAVLRNLESGKASAVKYVVRIAETAGVSEPSRNQVNE